MVERVVVVRAKAIMGEYNRNVAMAGTSTRQYAAELKKAAAALELEAIGSRTAAAAAAREARERAAAARAAGLAAKEKVAAAKSVGTAEAKAEATAAKTHAAASRQAALDAKGRAAAAKDLAIQADAASAAAKRESAIIGANAREHAAARESVARHTMVLGTGLVAAFGAAEYATLGFDRQMSAVGAASGAVGGDLMALRDAAIAAGQATVFGAKDAAVAEEELAKAGVSVKDVLSGGLIGSLNLATAGNLDLGRAAEIAASTMTQFKLAGRDIPHIADLLAAGAGKAQGSVEDLGLAMTYVGPVAGQMGVSVEETTGALAELASNGVLADKAGTGLRGVLMALTAPSAKAADTMKDLGVNVYDSKGKFVGFRGVAEQLHRSLSGLSAQQRDVALGTIFGNEQIVAARVLYAGGARAVDEWTARVNDSGYAARFAAARMDNLAGDLEQLRGSLETALIKGGTGATDVLRGLAQAATGAVNAFSELPEPVQTGLTATLALGGGVLLAAGAYGTFIPKLRTAREELEKTGRAGAAAAQGISALGKLGAAAAGLAAVYEGLHALSNEFDRLTGHGHMDPAVLAQHYGDLFVELAAGKAPVTALTDEIGQLSDMVAAGGVKAEAGRRGIAGLDAEMANFARGDVKNAQRVMETLTDALGAQGFTAAQVAEMFPQYAAAVKAAGAQAVLASGAQDGLNESISTASSKVMTYTSLMAGVKLSTDSLAESTDALGTAIKEMNTEYDHFIGANVNLVTAQANLNQGLRDGLAQLKGDAKQTKDLTGLENQAANARDRHKAAVDGLAEAQRRYNQAQKDYRHDKTEANLNAVHSAELSVGRAKDKVSAATRAQTLAQDKLTKARQNGAKATQMDSNSLDQNTDAGVKNIEMFGRQIDNAEDYRVKMKAAGASTDEANLAFWRQVAAIRQMGLDGGIAAGDLDRLLGRMLGVGATKVKPTIDANVADALRKVGEVARALAALKNHTVVYKFVSDATGWMLPPGAGPATATFAGGGVVGKDTSGPDPRDRYMIRARKDEALITPEARVMYGLSDAVVHAMNAGRAVPAGAAAGGGRAVSSSGGGLSAGDRALMRQFITTAASLTALADRPVVASISEREVYDANRRQTVRNARRR